MVSRDPIDRIDRQNISSTNLIFSANIGSLQQCQGRLLSQNLLRVLQCLHEQFVCQFWETPNSPGDSPASLDQVTVLISINIQAV